MSDKRLSRATAFALLPLISLSAGCAHDPRQPLIPESLLTCKPRPTVPSGDYTDNDLAEFILRLEEAGEDCRQRLGAVRGVVSGGEKPSGSFTE